jgi:hypothetical protein
MPTCLLVHSSNVIAERFLLPECTTFFKLSPAAALSGPGGDAGFGLQHVQGSLGYTTRIVSCPKLEACRSQTRAPEIADLRSCPDSPHCGFSCIRRGLGTML